MPTASRVVDILGKMNGDRLKRVGEKAMQIFRTSMIFPAIHDTQNQAAYMMQNQDIGATFASSYLNMIPRGL
jgi:hypothetical protein